MPAIVCEDPGSESDMYDPDITLGANEWSQVMGRAKQSSSSDEWTPPEDGFLDSLMSRSSTRAIPGGEELAAPVAVTSTPRRRRTHHSKNRPRLLRSGDRTTS